MAVHTVAHFLNRNKCMASYIRLCRALFLNSKGTYLISCIEFPCRSTFTTGDAKSVFMIHSTPLAPGVCMTFFRILMDRTGKAAWSNRLMRLAFATADHPTLKGAHSNVTRLNQIQDSVVVS